MQTPDGVIEIFLQPGDLYFGDRDTRVRTVLGSCVSFTFWHRRLQLGGMCHYMLPSRTSERRSEAVQELDGRYADEAITLLTKQIDAVGIPHREYQVKMFGGGNMFPGSGNENNNVGVKNIVTARNLVVKHGFNCVAEHVGGFGHRTVMFDVWDGQVWVRHIPIPSAGGVARGEPAQASDRRKQPEAEGSGVDWPLNRVVPCVTFA